MKKKIILSTFLILVGLGLSGICIMSILDNKTSVGIISGGFAFGFIILGIAVSINLRNKHQFESFNDETVQSPSSFALEVACPPSNTTSDENTLEDSPSTSDLVGSDVTNASINDKTIPLLQTPQSITFTLVRTNDFTDNLNLLMHKMNAKGLIHKSALYLSNFKYIEEHELTGRYIFEHEIDAIPSLSFVKEINRKESLNHIRVMAGMNDHSLEQIGYVPTSELVMMHQIFNEIHHVKGNIFGGSFKKWEEHGEVSQTGTLEYFVSLTVYFTN